MQAKTIGNYGGPFSDARPMENPETDFEADEGNRLLEDAAQMTRTSTKARITFATVTTGNATVAVRSQWGSGDAQKPTVTRTSLGRYTITFSASFDDGLGLADSVETVSFFDADARARSTNVSDDVAAKVLTVAGNVVTIATESPAGVLADVGNVSAAAFTVGVVFD